VSPMKRLIVALPEPEYRRLTEIAANQVREPEQQAVYYLRRALQRETNNKTAAPAGAAAVSRS
jgi:hypothetical protein